MPSEPVAVISNAEQPECPRARAARWIVRSLGIPDDEVIVAAGAPGAIDEPFAPGLCAAVDAASATRPLGPMGSLADVQRFIAVQQAAGRDVVWVCIGAMTNLAHVLADSTGPYPDRIFQQGGSADGDSTNFRLDPGAARAAFDLCARLRVPLAVLASDTTRWGLLWQDRGPAYASPLAARLKCWGADEAVVAAVRANATGRGGYSYGSSLHDPLTVIAALDSDCLCRRCSGTVRGGQVAVPRLPSWIPSAPASLRLGDVGDIAELHIAEGAVPARVAAVAAAGGAGENVAGYFWVTERLREAAAMLAAPPLPVPLPSAGADSDDESAAYCCVMSVGPLLPREVDAFAARLETVLQTRR